MATTGTTIDTLQVNITANAQSATASLKSLASALQKVRTALTGMKDGVSVSDHLSKSLNEMNGALNSITTGSIKKLQKFANALDGYANAVKKVGGIRGGKGITQKIADAMKIKDDTAISSGGSDTSDSADKIAENGEKVKSVWEKIGEAFGKAGKALKDFIHRHTQLLRTFGRIALYRMIRSAIKAISEAFSEGLKNAYGFSKQSESFTRLAETLDRIKSITSQMINQLGAWWGEVKQLVLPAIEWIVDKIRFAAEYLTELFAALNGAPTYLRAKYEAKAWDEATGKAKEYKHQLLGIDELNNLSAQKAGGASANTTDYKKLYEEVKVSEKLKTLADGIKEFAFKISDVLFDWSDLTAYDIEDKLIVGLSALTGGLIGGVPGAIVGTLAGIILTMIFSDLNPAEYTEKLGKKAIYKVIKPALFGLAGAYIGWKYGKGKGALVGASIGATLGLVLNKLDKAKANGELGKETLYKALKPALSALTGVWIGWKLGKGTGALVGGTIGLAIGFFLNGFDNAENGSATIEGFIKSIMPVLNGLAVGLLVFSATKNVSAALISGSIASAITFAIQELLPSKSNKTYTKEQIYTLISPGIVSLGFAGAWVGMKVAGIKGALIGFTIGITLGFVIENFEGIKSAIENFSFKKEIDSMVEDYQIKFNERVKEKTGGFGLDFKTGELHYQGEESHGASRGFGESNYGEAIYSRGAAPEAWRVDEAESMILNKVITDLTKDKKINPISGGNAKGATFVKLEAMGGINKPGTLFYAGEAGAEFVGNIGNTSAVANTGQMTDAIFKAAYMGMSKALKENGGGMNGYEPATMDDLFIAMKKKASNYNKRTGNPAFA